MSNDKAPVLVLVILDESGSMGNKRSDVIGGFNQFLIDQKKDSTPCRLMLTKFNTVCTSVEFGNGSGKSKISNIQDIPELTEKTYLPGGNTALYDAVAETIRNAEREKKDDERVLCVVVTDGEENSSRETTLEQIKELIQQRAETQGWTFLYIGENPEKWAAGIGVPIGTTSGYSHEIPRDNFQLMSYATSNYRNNPSADSSWVMTQSKTMQAEEKKKTSTGSE